jgi:hypothetical protein
MERRIGTKIESYIIEFKDAISSKIRELETASIDSTNPAHTCEHGNNTALENVCKQLTSFVYEYEKLKLVKEDFMKRKRVKNMVPIQQRCLAKRANGEQCTRKKKEGCDYCGTHTKGVPCNIMDQDQSDAPKPNQESINIWVQNIKGIEYFIDGSKNVYKHEDVINNSTNPRIIAKYAKNDVGAFSISFL